MKRILILITCYLALGVAVMAVFMTLLGKNGFSLIPVLLINPIGWLILSIWPVYIVTYIIIGHAFVL